jgi:peptidoglycan/xylan/chitin deacetylase (PgdA/CDA1 family)
MSGSHRRVPVLVTLDVHDQPKIDYYLRRSAESLGARGISATYFVPADVFRRYRNLAEGITSPHQIACHGFLHGELEFYDIMPEDVQRDYIRQATEIMSDGLGRHPGAFRAPGFRVSGATLLILQEYGYYADVSVNSGRLGITSSYNKENGWLWAPRLPYHPDARNAYRRGDLSLWEIPVSAFLLPFTINAGVAMGRHLSTAFASLLYRECMLRRKPVVYMAHPEDLCENGPEYKPRKFSFKLLLPTEYGFGIRHYLSAKKPEEFYRSSTRTLEYLLQRKDAVFLTVGDYIARYLSPDLAATRVLH